MGKVLYVGSGKSAELVKQIDTSEFTICAVNNAWQLFEPGELDFWIHPGDFPRKNYPPDDQKIKHKVTHRHYTKAVERVAKKLKWKVKNLFQHVGGTTFFHGAYWIMDTLKVDELYLLGFDHDYNPDKTRQWKRLGQPSPHNNFKGKRIEKIFHSYETDHFYGHGTPDPLRFPQKYLIEKFKQLDAVGQKLKVKIYNASDRDSNINHFERVKLC